MPLDEAALQAVRRMNASLLHRGPDDEGFFFDEHVALAMRRLSIIDVAGGHQPLHALDGKSVVVCNGEIYNYVELQSQLRARGCRFSTGSDVETVLPLYAEYGLDCIARLRGMFSFALWDRERRQLVLARDRFGEKPLYLHRDKEGRLWFASEMKALLAGIGRSRVRLSAQSAHLFLIYQYVPEPRTMFDSVSKLPAGHVLAVAPEELADRSRSPESRPYWRYRDAAPVTGNPAALVREALEEAGRITVRSDVPVGVALSGGIDSGLVAALARKSHPGELKAFSVGYPGRPDNDERSQAAALARQLGMPFYDVELSAAGFVTQFPGLVRDMDDPIGDIAAYGYHAVSALAREHGVPVLLSGLGADELFWGYEWVREAVQKTLDKGSRRMPRWLARMLDQHPRRAVFYDSLDWMRDSAGYAPRIMSASSASHLDPELWASYFESDDWGDVPLWLSDVQNKTWLASNCLALSDRVSMAHSVELRLPFLDFVLADVVTGLRRQGLADWKKPHKWLLVEAARDLLPQEVFARKKRGFTPPVTQWMDDVVAEYRSLLKRGSLSRHGILREDADEHLPGRHPVGLSYRAVLLEVWSRLLVDHADPDSIQPSAQALAIT